MDRDYSKLSADDAPWLAEPSARAVCKAIAAGGHDIFYVGGCVRNALLGAPVSDVDMATSATPDEVTALAQAAGLKPIPTGIDHGTITVVSAGTPYEVTTFRRDVATDGRRAVVAFSKDIADDARRRDFTMNALYATASGEVIDPLGGIPDLIARRVVFIEDAAQRIREDYLRTLRYFRFHAWYGDPSEGLNADALAAVSANLDGLETLSAERVGTEMRKLLSADDPSTALGAMAQTGVLQALITGADIRFVLMMVHGENVIGTRPDWVGRLVALGGEDVPTRLRLSRAETRKYDLVKSAAYDGMSLLETSFEHGTEIATQAYLLQSALSETPPQAEMMARITHAAEQKFPVTAADLMPEFQGPALGTRLADLKAAWIASGFALTKSQLLILPAP
ncbi:CCA tRNA nucleotidyltransferase [Sulfitobacter sp. HNIBRBA2951]|uniref:CCA tRNA nucleotidyltransferase n=1 Tax=Sulfitobacter aquimarinus TaxID=3158557 RepID=UPI0032E03C50